MEPILTGVGVAGVAVLVIYRFAKRQSQPVSRTAKPARTEGATGNTPRRSWLVKAYNSSGARKVDSNDLRGATAELAGRAAGAMGRRSKTRWVRRWTAVQTAAERSRTRRENRWQKAGRQPLLFSRKPKPTPEQVEPTAVIPPAKPSQEPRATPGPEPPKRHLRPVPDPEPTPGAPVTTTQDTPGPTTLAAPEAPPDWSLMADRIRGFAPEDDTALLAFMRGESVGILAYAEALEQARDNCVNDVGLDPSAVAGFTTYSEHVSEAAQRMSEAYKTFVAVYGEVQALAAAGVVMPYRGRFFTGEAG